MLILSGKVLRDLILSDAEDSIFLDPLLDLNQIGQVTVDIRLGYDFLVSVVTRKPYVELSARDGDFRRGIGSYFQETRRELGDKFVLYPGQVVVTTSLEYLSLPPNIYSDILTRSSYTRLGVHLNTMVQPGFKGCISLELCNQGNNAIEMIVGSRICQARFFQLSHQVEYIDGDNWRKYYGDVRPTVSKADLDGDLTSLRDAQRQFDGNMSPLVP
ncbi:dCTP deaminase [Methylolobus aquaticus]|nr:dCTP deaminase [Methylolobus aquaticus]